MASAPATTDNRLTRSELEAMATRFLRGEACPACHASGHMYLHPPRDPWIERLGRFGVPQRVAACWWVECRHCHAKSTAVYYQRHVLEGEPRDDEYKRLATVVRQGGAAPGAAAIIRVMLKGGSPA